MSKALTSVVIGIVGSAVLASSVLASSAVFDSAPIDNIEDNINVLKDKVVAFSENEEKLVKKYMELHEEYSKLKKVAEQDTDATADKKDNKNLESEIDRLKKELEKREQENKEQEGYIKELEEQLESLESTQVNLEEIPQVNNESEVE